MIYVKEEMLSVQEGLDRLADLSRGSHKEFRVRCDIQAHEKCRFEYKIEFRNFLKYINANNGKLCCIYCSRKTKFMGRNNPNAKYKFDDNWLKEIDTPEKAYALGWFASDSHINKAGIYLKINKCDNDVLMVIRDSIYKGLPIHEDRKRGMNELSLNSQTMARDAANHLGISFGKKSHSVKYPNIPSELNKFFVRGLFEGDGSVGTRKNKRPRCSIASCSASMKGSLAELYGGYVCSGAILWDRKGSLEFLNIIYTDREDLTMYRKFSKFKKLNELWDWSGKLLRPKKSGTIHSKFWTTEQLEMLENKRSTLSLEELSVMLNRSKKSVYSKLQKLGMLGTGK